MCGPVDLYLYLVQSVSGQLVGPTLFGMLGHSEQYSTGHTQTHHSVKVTLQSVCNLLY